MNSIDSKLPTHVSIIMDGNGRWAKQRGLDRVKGHLEGQESVRACMEAAVEAGIPYLSLFAFSEENWNRPLDEVNALMQMMAKAIKNEYANMMDHNVRFLVLGHRARLGKALDLSISQLEKATAKNSGTTLIVFLSYSGKWDMLQAMKRAAKELSPKDFQAMEEKDFEPYLVTAGIPDPDLLIRTSGELRISNYLLWQSAYTEFYFTDTLWPDFRKEAFREALAEYARRDRRYGKVK